MFGHDAFLCFSTRNYYGQNHKSFMTSQFVFMLFNSKACSIVLKTFIRIFVEKFLFVFLQIMHKSCWKLLFMKLLIISCFYKIKSKKKMFKLKYCLLCTSAWRNLLCISKFHLKPFVNVTNAKDMCNFEVRREKRNIIFIENDRVEKHKKASWPKIWINFLQFRSP